MSVESSCWILMNALCSHEFTFCLQPTSHSVSGNKKTFVARSNCLETSWTYELLHINYMQRLFIYYTQVQSSHWQEAMPSCPTTKFTNTIEVGHHGQGCFKLNLGLRLKEIIRSFSVDTFGCWWQCHAMEQYERKNQEHIWQTVSKWKKMYSHIDTREWTTLEQVHIKI
jgi:hypothetical protein